MSIDSTAPAPLTASLGLLERLARGSVTRTLTGLRRGQLVLDDIWGSEEFGEPADLAPRLRVHEPAFYRHALLGGTLSVAESYLRGDWDCGDLTSLFRLFIRNMHATNRFDAGLSRILGVGHWLYHHWHANTRTGSRRNIEAHYDLGNDFFRLWLDDTLAYSSGVFPRPDATLQQASVEKFDRICRNLALTSDDHVLEIGTGWGGFALHAAARYGCRVTTTTISQQQYELATQRIADAGLSDRITVLQQDYRDLTGQYDKLVSIEMIEAVGHRFYDAYFRKCGELLKPTGSFVLQGIVVPEGRYPAYLKSVDFIQRYIFPGGCLASVGSVLESVGRTSDLRVVKCEDFAPHYAETLRRWRTAFHQKLGEVRSLGYSDRFVRMWHYYLCYCEAVFEERYLGVVQLQFDKPLCRRDALINLSPSAQRGAA
uniref:Class I SAM-dependent methyltransferase n=1 Tax=Schlesneria paludicola TaxID=360056 RepID=A0A7C2K2T2_9PLAN